MRENRTIIPPFGLFPTILLFFTAAIILYIETNFLIPYLASVSSIENIIWWFIVAAFGMFIPLLLVAAFLLRKEGWLNKPSIWKDRLRFRKMTGKDWLWGVGGLIAISALSFPILILIESLAGPVNHQPPFMQFEPLGPGRYWILLVWLPYWIFNIMGEEILWRGVIMPRQEGTFGNYVWIVQGIGWGLFHIAFGWQLLIPLIPILFILPFIVQKRKNTWIGVFIHAGLNGPSFIAISLGLI